MSITFFAVQKIGDNWKPLWTCTNKECDGFCNDCLKHNLNVSSSNARDIIEWLDLLEYDNNGSLFGEIEALELAARCRRRLWDEERNSDPGLNAADRARKLGVDQSSRVITCGREPGYLQAKTKQILFIAECAGAHYVSWS